MSLAFNLFFWGNWAATDLPACTLGQVPYAGGGFSASTPLAVCQLYIDSVAGTDATISATSSTRWLCSGLDSEGRPLENIIEINQVCSPEPVTVVVLSPTDTGGGGFEEQYYFRDEEFWNAREEYLRSLAIEVEDEPGEDTEELQQAIAHYNEERSALIISIRSASDVKTMHERGKQLEALNKKLSDLIARLTVAQLKRKGM